MFGGIRKKTMSALELEHLVLKKTKYLLFICCLRAFPLVYKRCRTGQHVAGATGTKNSEATEVATYKRGRAPEALCLLKGKDMMVSEGRSSQI
jgi:hypothetical protein